MASTADQLSALGRDQNFAARVMALALQYAVGTVYGEDPATPNHAIRVGFARTVFNGGGTSIPNVIASSANLVAANTSYDFASGRVQTDASDAAISSQIASDWNLLAGV